MTEIKLTKRYPLSRTEDITDAYMRGWNDALDAVQNGKFHIAEQTEPQTDCYVSDLCKHYGDKQICGRCRSRNLFCEAELQPKTEPQYDFGEYADRLWKIAYERGKREALEQTCRWWDGKRCHGIGRDYQPKDEPQTERRE